MYLMPGTKELHSALGNDALTGSLSPLITVAAEKWNLQRPDLMTAMWKNDILCELQKRINTSVADVATLKIHNDMVNSLRSATNSSSDWEATDVFLWIYKSTDGFLGLVEAENQEAMAILAHLCILIKRAETQWWLQGWANRIMSEVHGRLDEQHRPWIQKAAEDIGWFA